MSGKADSCAASVKPAGPQPTMRTSTSCRDRAGRPDAACRCAGSEISGSPGSKSVEMELHENRSLCVPRAGMSLRPGLRRAAGVKVEPFAEFDQYADYQYTCQAYATILGGFGER